MSKLCTTFPGGNFFFFFFFFFLLLLLLLFWSFSSWREKLFKNWDPSVCFVSIICLWFRRDCRCETIPGDCWRPWRLWTSSREWPSVAVCWTPGLQQYNCLVVRIFAGQAWDCWRLSGDPPWSSAWWVGARCWSSWPIGRQCRTWWSCWMYSGGWGDATIASDVQPKWIPRLWERPYGIWMTWRCTEWDWWRNWGRTWLDKSWARDSTSRVPSSECLRPTSGWTTRWRF